MAIRTGPIVAILIAAGVGGWMWSGEVVEGGTGPQGDAVIISERNAEAGETPFAVRTALVDVQERAETLVVRGRTEADASIPVRSETAGTLEERLVSKGDRVTPGTEVCRLDAGTRESVLRQAEASLAQARASLEQAEFDLESNTQLAERGFAAESRLNGFRSAVDAARAQVAGAEAQIAQAEEEIARTVVVARATGIVQDPVAEPGDVLQVGGVCVTLVDLDPLVVTGQVPETEVGALSVGMNAAVRLVTGEEAEGQVRFIAPAADPETRSFAIEIAIPNDDERLRAGVTATADIPLAPTRATPILASWITLDDEGRLGVGTVNNDGTVDFAPIRILAQDIETTWVAGLEPGTRVITLGSDYVVPGQRVLFEDDAEPAGATTEPERVALARTSEGE